MDSEFRFDGTFRSPFETTESVKTDESMTSAIHLYHKTFVAAHIMMFQIGFILFEWGASRRKCSESAMVKHPIMLTICSLTTVVFGFGLAYGDPHILGSKYFFVWGIVADQDNKELPFDLPILTLCTLSVSTLAISALNERQGFGTQIAYGLIISFLVPLVTAWTFGKGYLAKLYLQDESACLSVHFVAGICALMGCFFIQPRLCRYKSEDTMVFD